MSKKIIDKIDYEDFKLSSFTYKVAGCLNDSRFVQVECDYICNEKKIKCFIDYPKGFCKDDEEYIIKAKEFMQKITENGEIYAYTALYLNKKSYIFNTPLNLGKYNFKQYQKEEAKKKMELVRLAKLKEKQAQILAAKKAEELRLKQEDETKKRIKKELAMLSAERLLNRIKELEMQNNKLLKENNDLKKNSKK